VGSINVDFVVRAARLPRAAETVSGGTFERHFGGKGANQAVAAARLGASVTLVGAVGDDDLGAAAVGDLRSEGVDVAGVRALAGFATGVALIVVDEAGQNQIAVASGANAALDGEVVADALVGAIPVAEQGVVLAVFEVGDEAVAAGARFAAAQQLTLVVNVAPARPLPAAVVDAAAIVVVNEGEAEALTGEGDLDAAALKLARLTGAPAIVTLGADGAALATGRDLVHIPTPAVDVVDATGAGDAFMGALAAELARGASVEQAARFAVAAASMSVTAAGARGGLPRRKDFSG
jgi:ribokinase